MAGQSKPREELLKQKKRQLAEQGLRLRRHPKSESDGGVWLQPFAPPGAKRNKSSTSSQNVYLPSYVLFCVKVEGLVVRQFG
jgi:hypothetical protein